MSTQLYNMPTCKIYLIFVHIGVSNLIGSSSIEFENFKILDRKIRCILLLCGKGYLIYLIGIVHTYILAFLSLLINKRNIESSWMIKKLKDKCAS